jgi:hypothetical protein
MVARVLTAMEISKVFFGVTTHAGVNLSWVQKYDSIDLMYTISAGYATLPGSNNDNVEHWSDTDKLLGTSAET